VARAAEFIEASAGQPITVAEVAARAGVTVFALRYSFQQHFGTTPERYVRRIRLEHAQQDLQQAESASGMTPAGVARRWGWGSLIQFNLAYRRRFGRPPGGTAQN
jgi:transcriptional regulator GlxA family with amidase domain